ncbi:MAG: T9SS type A sorting domain-containing protein, partial [Phaeodactylibacter sp.]|nr:T9SS type A sorting domain-containing protein [Phaeodactylibacter sp.]
GNIDGLDSWLANHGRATATDNCRQITWSDDYMALNSLCGETGSATVTFTATDLCGNPASTTATFTIEDSTPPQGSCPQGFNGLTDTAQAPAPDVVLIENLYSDLCGGISVEVNTETEVETTCQGAEFEVRHVYTITDDCGNPTICVVTHAGLAPTEITGNCPDGEANLQCPNEVPPPDTQYIASFYTGADGRPVAAILSNIDASETDSCGFAITYEYTIHDNCGNTLTCGVTYSGEDTIPPQGSCPEGYEVASLEDAPPPDAGWIGSFYSDNCGPVSVQVLNTTQTGSFCEGFAVTHDYIVRDACGQDNTTLCSVSFTVPPASPLDGACPSGISGLQCWAEAPGHEEALDTVQNAYPFAAVIYLGTTTINNYCQFTIRHSYSIDDPCSGRIICVLEYSGQDQTPPEGSCPDGIEGLSCQVDVPAPGPNSIAAGYSDNCSTVHAYLMETITNGDDCGPFSVTYRYNVYDDCDNSAICEVSHTGVGLGMRPTPSVIHIEENTEGLPESPLPGFKAYPNPTTGELFLELNYLNEEEARLEIYNILGKRLLSKTTEPGQLVHRLDLARERLPNGTYLITVRKGKMCITRRVLLKKD